MAISRYVVFTTMIVSSFAVIHLSAGESADMEKSKAMLRELSGTGDGDHAAAVLKGVWFNPKNKPSGDKKAPVAIIMTGKRFDSSSEYLPDPWIGPLVRTLFTQDYCCLVLSCSRSSRR